jgi:hypothetical protein
MNIIKIPLKYQVIDDRVLKDFSQQTFSGYKKTEVLKVFKTKLINPNNLNEVCKWLCEIHSSGYLEKIWDIIISVMSLNINIANPSLPGYINNYFNRYIKISSNINNQQFLYFRNNQEIRNILVDLISVICLSPKNEIITKINIKIKDEDIFYNNIKTKLQASNLSYITKVISKNNPSEIKLACNEIIYHLKNRASIFNIFYWIYWLIYFEKYKRKKEEEFSCISLMTHEHLNDKYRNDWIWLIWDILKHYSFLRFNSSHSNLVIQINCLYNFFKYKYTSGKKNKRLPLILHAFLLLVNEVEYKIPISVNPNVQFYSQSNINFLYKNINEFSVLFNKDKLDDNMEEINENEINNNNCQNNLNKDDKNELEYYNLKNEKNFISDTIKNNLKYKNNTAKTDINNYIDKTINRKVNHDIDNIEDRKKQEYFYKYSLIDKDYVNDIKKKDYINEKKNKKLESDINQYNRKKKNNEQKLLKQQKQEQREHEQRLKQEQREHEQRLKQEQKMRKNEKRESLGEQLLREKEEKHELEEQKYDYLYNVYNKINKFDNNDNNNNDNNIIDTNINTKNILNYNIFNNNDENENENEIKIIIIK